MNLFEKAVELKEREQRYIYYKDCLISELANEHLKPASQRFLFTNESECQAIIDKWEHKIAKINEKLNHIKELI